MAVSIVQSDEGSVVNGSASPSFGSNVTNGNDVIIAIVRWSGTGTFSVSCSEGALSLVGESADGSCMLWRKRNCTGGWQSVTVTVASGTYWSHAYREITGMDDTAAAQTDTNSEASATSHECAATGLSGTGLYVGLAYLHASVDHTPGSGWTDVFAGQGVMASFIQTKIQTGSTEVGPFTTSPASVTDSLLVYIPQSGSGGGGGEDMLTSLVSFWPCDEESDGSVAVDRADAHGANDLTDNNNCPSGTGLVYANDLDLTNGKALIHSDNADLSMGNISFTIAAWVKLSSKAANRPVVTKGDPTSTNEEYMLEYLQSSDRWSFLIYGGDSRANGSQVLANSFGSPSTGSWQLLVAWYDSAADVTKICVNDGTVDSGGSQSLGAWDGSQIFVVAYTVGSGDVFLGDMGPIMLWKRVLTSGEITWLYNSGSGRAYTEFGVSESGLGIPHLASGAQLFVPSVAHNAYFPARARLVRR